MVRVSKLYAQAVKSLWDGKCTVTVQKNETNTSTGRTEVKEVDLYKDVPCRISFDTIDTTELASNAAQKVQGVTLLIGSDVDIPPGSKITVTQNGVTGSYTKSGKPAVYSVHQQIQLELFKGWA